MKQHWKCLFVLRVKIHNVQRLIRRITRLLSNYIVRLNISWLSAFRIKGSRLTLNYDLFKIFDKDLIKVGHWKNSSLEILENLRINTESSKIDLMGAQIRISAVNVSS